MKQCNQYNAEGQACSGWDALAARLAEAERMEGQAHERVRVLEGRVAELEAKLRLTEGAFKNSRIRELEAALREIDQLSRATGNAFWGALYRCGALARLKLPALASPGSGKEHD